MPESLRDIIISKGWLLKDVAHRWNITTRRLQQILRESTTRHRDSVNGLPNKNLQEEQEMSANVSFQTYDDQQVEFFTGQCRHCGSWNRYYPDGYATAETRLPKGVFDCCCGSC
jgi:hypothetical protein